MTNTHSTPIKIKAKLGLHGVLDTEAVKTFTLAYNGLLNNPAFTNTPVDLAKYKAGIDSFAALVLDAADGGKKAIKAKDARVFSELLRQAGVHEGSPEWKNAWKAFYSG